MLQLNASSTPKCNILILLDLEALQKGADGASNDFSEIY